MPQAPEQDLDRYGGVTAAYYDAAYAVLRDASGDVAFYRELARASGGPVLELGCGTGRVLLEVAKLGLACCGVDLSPGMLAGLRAKSPPPALRLVQAPMQRFDLGPQRFALIYAAFRAFQHLYTVEDQLACLARVRRHLAPGGVFAFDVFQPRLDRTSLREEPESEGVHFRIGDDDVVRYERVLRDIGAQLLTVTMRYERKRPDGSLANDSVEFQMRWFYRYEIEHLLARAGFREIQIFGDFQQRPFTTDSPEILAVARA